MKQDKSKKITIEEIAKLFEPKDTLGKVAKLFEDKPVPVAELEERHYTEPQPIKCKWCGSIDTMKYGIRDGVQQYICLKCRRRFNTKDAPYKMRTTVEQIGASLKMFYDGLFIFGRDALAYSLHLLGWTYREIAEVVGVSFKEVGNLCNNFNTKLFQQEYVSGLTPEQIATNHNLEVLSVAPAPRTLSDLDYRASFMVNYPPSQ